MITQNSSHSLAEGITPSSEVALCEYWCSLDDSLSTLFQSIAGGVSWREPLQPLMSTTMFMPAVFNAYITLVYFAVLNVVTAVFCSRAMETTSKNPELVTSALIMNRAEYLKSLSAFFKKIDKAGKGAISLADFERALKDPDLCAHLHTLEMDSADAWALFRLIDTDQSGLISIDEFIEGCECLKGSAKGVQLAKMSLEHRHLTRRLMQF
eukprot:CAMPEP_0170323604 /NCGR_PEP_ID=MMETSP0116_2-20130129/62614_1 /TAXON_ID=400756 /ORGANISM="Durinskia baltica, Strain CSIRO CS-38" /LENGTH=209 /DNA_ID=CAMNT_0010576531 /DNA_START=154 /DNA_END=780 /DNA_ORIENTATION=+